MAALFWLTFGLVGALCVLAPPAARAHGGPGDGSRSRRLSIVHAIARLNVGGAART